MASSKDVSIHVTGVAVFEVNYVCILSLLSELKYDKFAIGFFWGGESFYYKSELKLQNV